MSVDVQCIVPSQSLVGEGAVWDVDDAALWWVDIKANLVHKYDPASGKNSTYDFAEPVGCLARRDKGGLIVAAKSGFYFYDPETDTREALFDPETDLPDNRFNDGATDSLGRFWAGTMKDGGGPAQRNGKFYRFDQDQKITQHFGTFFTTNGLAFSPDGRTMYFSDSNADVQAIWACDYDTDTGTPSNRRIFFDTREVAGRPDGASVDSDGCYWMAGVSGWQLVRITPAGKVDQIIKMPIEKPTKPMFGGPNLETLYVTSIGAGCLDDQDQPDAGGLFAVSGLGVTGFAQTRYKG